MSDAPQGPGSPFTTLFDDTSNQQAPALSEAFQRLYGGDWHFEPPRDRPYTYSNFVISRDGRISYSLPDHVGGGAVSGFNAHDAWLMGLLRARADAVIVGDVTLRVEPEHLWTSEFIFPKDASAFAALRSHWGLQSHPIQVFLSLEGDLNPEATVWQHPELPVIVATTARGRARVQEFIRTGTPKNQILLPDVGDDTVNLERLMQVLYAEYGIKTLLCEGGPRVYGSFVGAKLMDEEFLALSPIVIGQDATRSRPGLIEGMPFTPETSPRSKPISLKRAGDYLFLRSKLEYPNG